MDILKLDSSTYAVTDLVGGYSSAIWTERFQDLGEFEIRTPNIESMRALLPEDSLISHQQTQEVMVVDTHAIEKDEEGTEELVLRGQSLEGILRGRFFSGAYREEWKAQYLYSSAYASAMLVFNFLCNPHGRDVTRAAFYDRPATENLPNAGVAIQDAYAGQNLEWWMNTTDNAHQILLDWLARENLGIRCARPTDAFKYVDELLFYPKTYDSVGNASVDSTTGKLRFITYTGYDRSVGNVAGLTPVTFSYDMGHLKDPKYLFSNRDFINQVDVVSEVGTVSRYDPGLNGTVTGIKRRRLVIDGGDPGTLTLAQFTPAMQQKGDIELKKHMRMRLFDAEITELTNYRYGWHYDLGDKVTLLGQYGFRPTMQVAQHTRIEDNEGDRGYPTLVLV